jgi:hypothetical protein
MADQERDGRPARVGLVLAFVVLGLLVLVSDWALGLIFG